MYADTRAAPIGVIRPDHMVRTVRDIEVTTALAAQGLGAALASPQVISFIRADFTSARARARRFRNSRRARSAFQKGNQHG